MPIALGAFRILTRRRLDPLLSYLRTGTCGDFEYCKGTYTTSIRTRTSMLPNVNTMGSVMSTTDDAVMSCGAPLARGTDVVFRQQRKQRRMEDGLGTLIFANRHSSREAEIRKRETKVKKSNQKSEADSGVCSLLTFDGLKPTNF